MFNVVANRAVRGKARPADEYFDHTGDVDSIDFLHGDARGHAVAHCSDVTPEIERSVACGGFAAEFYLLKNRYAEKGADDENIGPLSLLSGTQSAASLGLH